MMGCASVSPGGSCYPHYCHNSFCSSAEGGWQRNSRILWMHLSATDCTLKNVLCSVSGVQANEGFLSGFLLFSDSFQKLWRRRRDKPFCRYLCVHLDVTCWARPATPAEPTRCVLNEFWGSSASQEWLKGQLFSWRWVCDFCGLCECICLFLYFIQVMRKYFLECLLGAGEHIPEHVLSAGVDWQDSWARAELSICWSHDRPPLGRINAWTGKGGGHSCLSRRSS